MISNQNSIDVDLLKARFARIEQNLPCVVYEYESDTTGIGSFVYFTPYWETLTEVSRDRAIADVNVALGLIHHDDIEEFLHKNEHAARTHSVFQHEFRIVTPSGKTKWISLTSRPEPQDKGEIILWNGIMVDISVDKRVKEDLKASNHRFQQMESTLPCGLYEYVLYPDRSSLYLYMSPRAEEIYECSLEELRADMSLFWDMVHSDDIDRLRSEDISANDDNRLFVSEFRIIPRSGKTKWVRLSSLPDKKRNTYPAVWFGVIEDITDEVIKRQQAENSIRQIERDLFEARIEKGRAEERESILRDLHDGFGSTLVATRILASNSELTNAEIINILDECLDDLHLIVDNLGYGNKSLARALFMLKNRLERRAIGEKFKLIWEISLNGLPDLPDRKLLQILRITQEAITNSLKHSHASHITVVAEYTSGGCLDISISDNGTGLTKNCSVGSGLTNIRRRANEIGAHLLINSAPGNFCLNITCDTGS
jgi:PAS domain S-box-containing protein